MPSRGWPRPVTCGQHQHQGHSIRRARDLTAAAGGGPARGAAGPVRAGGRPAAAPRVLVVASPVDVVAGQVGGIVVAELITGGALILLLALGGRWLIGRGLAPLSEMAGTAQRITTQGNLTTRMPDADGSTEVGKLGTAINTMLDRIQQAFGARLRSEAKVRQFAADASHELRTPLTTIRGYAELYRQGALDGGQLPDAMRRIEQEARRMGTLVAGTAGAGPAGPHVVTRHHRDGPGGAGAGRGRRRPGGGTGPAGTGGGPGVPGRGRGRGPDPPGAGQPARQRPRAHPGDHGHGGPACPGPRRRGAGGRGRRPRHGRRRRRPGVRPVLPGCRAEQRRPIAGPAVGYGTDHGPGSARSASPHSGNGDAAESGGSGSASPSSPPSPRRMAGRPLWSPLPAAVPGSASGSRPPRLPRPAQYLRPGYPAATSTPTMPRRRQVSHWPRPVGYPAAPPRQPIPPRRTRPHRPSGVTPPGHRPCPAVPATVTPSGQLPVPPAQQPPFPRPGTQSRCTPPRSAACPGQPTATCRSADVRRTAASATRRRQVPGTTAARAPPAPRPGTGNSGPGELHHDWLEPPRPPPPRRRHADIVVPDRR